MSIVINRAGEEICFEIALTEMNDDLREQLEAMRLPTKQAFFTAYEIAYEREMKSVWKLSKPRQRVHLPHDLRILAEAV